MSKKRPPRRRRPPRNIWSVPPVPSEPFDYEESFRVPTPAPEPVQREPEPVYQDPEPVYQQPEPVQREPESIYEAPPPEVAPELEPEAPRPSGGKHLRRRRVVVLRSTKKRGRHSLPEEPPAEPVELHDEEEIFEWPGEVPEDFAAEPLREPAPTDGEDVIETEDVIEAFEPPEYRGRHLASGRRARFPRPRRSGKHSIGVQPEARLEPPPVEEEPFAEAQPLDAPVDEAIPPFDPDQERPRTRRSRKGKHLGPSKRLLLPEKTRPGKHALRPREEPAPEPDLEAFIDEAAVVIEEEAAVQPEPELEAQPEPEPEPEPEEALDEAAVIVEEETAEDGESVYEDLVDDGFDEVLDEEPDEVVVPPRPRRSRARRRRRQRAKQFFVGLLAALVVGSGTVAVGSALDTGEGKDDERGTSAVVVPEETTSPIATLMYGTQEARPEKGALWISLFVFDPNEDRSSIVYIPAHTAVEVPGRGLLPLGESLASGGPALLLVSTENLLGVHVDRYIELSDSDSRLLFDETGPLTVDVPSEVRVPAGPRQAKLIFVEGPQELSSQFLSRLIYTRGLDVDDLEFGARLLAFWQAFFDEFAGDRVALREAVIAAGTALDSDESAEVNAEFFEAIAATPSSDLLLSTLPVREISAGDSELYSVDPEELSTLIRQTFGAPSDQTDEVRVQVLNGNGEPGIGQEVAERLVGEGFRVILSGNARTLDYETTLIVTYDSSDEGIALAERARDLLGVGEVQIATQQQGIVDLTIVVGKDFLRAP